MSTEIEIVGYLRASQEGQPEWSEDCVCEDAVYPNYDGDDSVSMPICRLADVQAIIAQRDARIGELERDLSLAHMACELAEEELAALNKYKRFESLYAESERELAALKAQQPTALGQAATDVIAERKRQITEEGWTPGHDDRHTCGELADAAACYALWGGGSSPHNFDQFWPWGMSRLKFGQARQMLIKSGALILAEIERLDRAAAPSAQQKESGDE